MNDPATAHPPPHLTPAWQQPDPRLLKAWRMLLWCIAGPILSALAIGNLLAWTLDGPTPLRIILAALFSALAAVSLWLRHYLRLALAARAWALADDGLLLRRGVWWRHEIFVPRARIQHTDVTEGPIARRFGIATLAVHTAGTRVQELDVEGLLPALALQLREDLLRRSGASDVGAALVAATDGAPVNADAS